MTDKELLELAAKAAGIKYKEDFVDPLGGAGLYVVGGVSRWYWNPLTDDGDALRLAVKLGMLDGGLCLMINSRFNSTNMVQCYTNEKVIAPDEWMQDDPYAATRRAIVRAAAEIGRTL